MRIPGAIMMAGAMLLTACERPSPVAEKGGEKPRTLAEIAGAVTRLEEQNRQLEASVRKLEQGTARWVMWQSAQPVHAGSVIPPPPQPVDAFPDREPCIEAAKAVTSGARRALNQTGPLSVQAVGADGVLMQITYTCLPETVDPRRAPAR